MAKAVRNKDAAPAPSVASIDDDRLFAMRLERSRADLFEPLARLYGADAGYQAFTTDLVALLKQTIDTARDKVRDMDRGREL